MTKPTRTMTKRITKPILALFMIAGLGAGSASAAPAAPAKAKPATSETGVEAPAAPAAVAPTATAPTEITRFTLAELGFGDGQRHYGGRSTVTLPLPTRTDRVLVAATLELELASASFDTALTGLEVLVGGERVALFDQHTLASTRHHRVVIPPALVDSQSSFTLRAIMANVTCDGAVTAGAWQFLEGGNLELQSSPLRLGNELGSLPLPFYDAAFDRQGTEARKLSVAVAFLHPPAPEHVRIMSLIASWLGIHGHEHATFDVSVGSLPIGHAIVLVEGDKDAALLGLPAPVGPALRMMDNPKRPDGTPEGLGKLLVVSGRNAAELAVAATALMDGSVLKGETVNVTPRPAAPASAAYAAPRWIAARDVVPLGSIPGGKDLTHEGTDGTTMKLRFRLPPDLFFWLNQNPQLDLGYDELLAPGVLPPKVAVELNGHYLGTLPAPKVRGGGARDRVRLRVNRDHLAGYNELLIHLDYGKAACGGGGGAGGKNTRFTIDPDGSAFRFTGFTHFASLPDLSLFVHDGFPFTRRPDLGETIAVLPDQPQPAEIGSLLSLVSGFAAVTGQAATGLTVTSATDLLALPPRAADLLVVGAAENQSLLRAYGPRLPLQAYAGRAEIIRPESGLLDLARAALGGRLFDGEVERASDVLEHLSRYAAVTAAESPLAAGRTAVFVTASSAADMPSLPVLQGHAESHYKGSDVLVVAGQSTQPGQQERWMFRVGLAYESGALSAWHAFLWHMSQHWMALFPAALLGIVLCALVLRNALRIRVRKRLLEIGESAP